MSSFMSAKWQHFFCRRTEETATGLLNVDGSSWYSSFVLRFLLANVTFQGPLKKGPRHIFTEDRRTPLATTGRRNPLIVSNLFGL